MKGNIQEREYDKFRDASNGKSKVATVLEQTDPIPTSDTFDLPDGYIGRSIFGQALSVPSGSETIILTHIVSAQALILDRIEVSGSNRALFKIYIDDVLIGMKRSNNLILENEFNFLSLKLITSNKIEVTVLHNKSDSGDFESRLIGVEKT